MNETPEEPIEKPHSPFFNYDFLEINDGKVKINEDEFFQATLNLFLSPITEEFIEVWGELGADDLLKKIDAINFHQEDEDERIAEMTKLMTPEVLRPLLEFIAGASLKEKSKLILPETKLWK